MRRIISLAIAIAIAIALPIFVPWTKFLLTMVMANGIAALGVAILLRGGLISIGQAMYVAAGAYCVAMVGTHFGVYDFALVFIFAVLGAVLLTVITGILLVRYRAIYFAMLTLALSMIVYTLLAKLYSITGGSDGIGVKIPTVLGMNLSSREFEYMLYYFAVVMMLISGVSVHLYWRSAWGKAFDGLRVNEIRLEYLGVSARSVVMMGFAIAGCLAGVSGVLIGFAVGRAIPDMSFWTASADLILIAVLGGIGSVIGPFIGALFVQILHVAATSVTEAWSLIVGVVLILVLVYLPAGLVGLWRRKNINARSDT